MKRKLIYLIGLLVILAGVLGPALYMHKVFSSQQQYRQAQSSQTTNYSATEQENALAQSQSAAGSGQPSAGISATRPSGESTPSPSPAAKEKAGAAGGSQNKQSTATSRQSTASGGPDESTSAAPEDQAGCEVWVAVIGKNDEFLFRPAQVTVKPDNKWGVTALGALDATGLLYAMKPAWPDFVDSIGGQACSGMAGWMYSVNGEVPMHMASKHPVKTGDKVIWWYSRSMDQPPPRWEDLVSKK
ncbi:DUF4430 domain-containing protein [Desulfofundulus thermosubterraneus]|uniref:Transcobalamin-like C-terminal domain-containing protein n=1 Tax=Desulfofundulus thermosubterraneus DSM 16057 TaxID=1121432 RepID=A0A1M6EH89_9FIRM|nr:DUF4430 domain-containing protein [Desulfofundulus thermosubterraneus]SHI84803.1 protein of unknown function [Desulfofundulus thermosubterraneus DSM 16057]